MQKETFDSNICLINYWIISINFNRNSIVEWTKFEEIIDGIIISIDCRMNR